MRGLHLKDQSSNTTAEFVKDAVANFVLQSLMKRLCSEFTWAQSRSTFQTAAVTSEEDLKYALDVVSEDRCVWDMCWCVLLIVLSRIGSHWRTGFLTRCLSSCPRNTDQPSAVLVGPLRGESLLVHR